MLLKAGHRCMRDHLPGLLVTATVGLHTPSRVPVVGMLIALLRAWWESRERRG